MTIKNQTRKRTKGKNLNTFKLKDVYKEYIQLHPKGTDFYIDFKSFTNSIVSCFKLIMSNVLEESDEIYFPHRLGSLSIVKTKTRTKKLYIDFKSSREEGMTIYHLNDHSNGYRFRFRWRKHMAKFINKKYYSFVPARQYKRKLAKLIKEGKTDYIGI